MRKGCVIRVICETVGPGRVEVSDQFPEPRDLRRLSLASPALTQCLQHVADQLQNDAASGFCYSVISLPDLEPRIARTACAWLRKRDYYATYTEYDKRILISWWADDIAARVSKKEP